MPRPKPKPVSRLFTAMPYQLADTDTRALLRLLSYPHSTRAAFKDASKPINLIQTALGLYVDGHKHIDYIPRPADYRQAFRPVCRDALKLLNTILAWNEYYRDEFMRRGGSFDEVSRTLGTLVDVSVAVVADMTGNSSKGARKNTALTEVIRRLRKVFSDCYRGEATPRSGRELDFVKTALRAARCIPPNYAQLPRLFRDPRCALPEHRAKTIKRIASKVNRLRGQERDAG